MVRESKMKTYKDLNKQEQALYNKIQDLFVYHPSISRTMFCKVLGVVLNKYKYKKGSISK